MREWGENNPFILGLAVLMSGVRCTFLRGGERIGYEKSVS